MSKRKKLYFDVALTRGTNWYLAPCTKGFSDYLDAITLSCSGTGVGSGIVCTGNHDTGAASVNCSAINSTRRVTERYGGFLDTLPALTAGSSPELRRRNSVSAWFQQAANSANLSGTEAIALFLEFIRPGRSEDGGCPASVPIRYLTGAPALSVPGKLGQDAVFATEFGVVLFMGTGNSRDLFGTLYVQRQHSIEV